MSAFLLAIALTIAAPPAPAGEPANVSSMAATAAPDDTTSEVPSEPASATTRPGFEADPDLAAQLTALLPATELRVERGPADEQSGERDLVVTFLRHGDRRFSLAAQVVITAVGRTVSADVSDRARLTLVDGPTGVKVPLLQRHARDEYLAATGAQLVTEGPEAP